MSVSAPAPTVRLVPASGFAHVPQYAHRDLPGADRVCRVAEPVLDRLLTVQRVLRSQSTPRHRFDLLLWDAHRSPATQRRLFEDYADRLVREEGLTAAAATVAAARYVSRPDTVHPHGTGGAVDLTLLVNDEEAPMGTEFDAFEEAAACDWYRRHPPVTPAERRAAVNRERLLAVMRHAGFVAYRDEWWHYEWGTARWAEETGGPVLLDVVLAVEEQGPARSAPAI